MLSLGQPSHPPRELCYSRRCLVLALACKLKSEVTESPIPIGDAAIARATPWMTTGTNSSTPATNTLRRRSVDYPDGGRLTYSTKYFGNRRAPNSARFSRDGNDISAS